MINEWINNENKLFAALFCVILSWMFLDFGLSIGQSKQFEDVTLKSWCAFATIFEVLLSKRVNNWSELLK